MGIIKNKRAQIEIFALALLVTGVVAVSSAGLLGLGKGAGARSEFIREFLFYGTTIENMEIFYNDMMYLATTNVLEKQGHDMNNFCPLAVTVNDDLKKSIIDEAENLIVSYGSYKNQELPHMKSGSASGTLNIINNEESTQTLKETGSYINKITVSLAREEYVTNIAALATAGGENILGLTPTVDLKVEAKDASGNVVCSHDFGAVQRHASPSALFQCDGMVKTIEGVATNGGNILNTYIDNLGATIYSPALGYLEISGKPLEKLEVKNGNEKVKIESSGAFSIKIPPTADARPDLAVNFIRLKDSAGNIITRSEANQPITIEVEFANLGCAKINKNSRVIINAAGTVVLDTTTGSFGYTEKRILTATWTPTVAGNHIISASIDEPDNVVSEGDEANNKKMESIRVGGIVDLRIAASDIRTSINPIKVGDIFSITAAYGSFGTSGDIRGYSIAMYLLKPGGSGYAGCFRFEDAADSGLQIPPGTTYDVTIENCKGDAAGTYTIYTKFTPSTTELDSTKVDNEITKTVTIS